MTGATMRGDETRAYRIATDLPLLPLVVLSQLFLFTTGYYLFGPEWNYDGALLYIIMVSVTLGLIGYTVASVPETQRRAYFQRLVPTAPIVRGIAYWSVGFWATWATVLVLFEVVLSYEWPVIAGSTAGMMVFFTAFFVAPAEELLFRGYLPNLHLEKFILGKIPVILITSQVIFALFHVAAYGGVGPAMAVTFGLGLAWVFIARKFSLFATMGSHTAYNLCVLGILTGGV